MEKYLTNNEFQKLESYFNIKRFLFKIQNKKEHKSSNKMNYIELYVKQIRKSFKNIIENKRILKGEHMVKPIGNKLVVEQKAESEEKIGSLYIPDSAKEKPQEGKVIAVGRGVYEHGVLVPLEVEVNDTIIYNKYAGSEIKVNNKSYIVINEKDILVILKGDK